MRKSVFERRTKETYINIDLNLDLADQNDFYTGIGFFDHMLDAMLFRAGFTIQIECQGDLEIDAHHTVEDIGICIGQALKIALGDKKGITRFASASVPMDEALVHCSLDISGRGFLVYNADVPVQMCGNFPSELAEEFFRALAHNAGITLHINMAYGKNAHHMLEAMFKSVGAALGTATRITNNITPSTKGVL